MSNIPTWRKMQAEYGQPPVKVEDLIMAYEEGELDQEGIFALFQHLVDTGMAWSLQGSYSRTAMILIREGAITAPETDAPRWGRS